MLAARRLAAAPLRRRRRGARPDARDVRLPAAQGSASPIPGGGELIDRVLADLQRPHRPRRRAGGRHHHGHAPAHARRAGSGQRRRPARRSPVRAAQRRATSAWPWRVASAVDGRSASPTPARAPEDRRRRGDDERDGARQRATATTARQRRGAHRPTAACASRSPTRRGARRTAEHEVPDLEVKLAGPAEAARLGAVPDREHGRRDARDERRGAAHARAGPPPGGSPTMTTRERFRPSADGTGSR